MGGAIKSVGGFLGLGNGGEPDAVTGNAAANQLNWNATDTNSSQNQDYFGEVAAGGDLSAHDLRNLPVDMQNALASGAMTGTGIARQALGRDKDYNQTMQQGQQQYGQANDLYNNTYGQLQGAEGRLQGMQDQGFELKPEDQTLYGQTSGNIARMFGQQGNQAGANLAMRGLSNSGAAGATFSGLQGNQNEMLAQAQQQIMQQRFQNTQNQVAQQQSFINNMAGQAGNANKSAADINQNLGNYAGQQLQNQYGRQLAGAQQYTSDLSASANAQNAANQQTNSANMSAFQNKPGNIGDLASGMFSANPVGAISGAAGAIGGAAGSLFGGGASEGVPDAGGTGSLPGRNTFNATMMR